MADRTEIVFVLDRSGSMSSRVGEVLEGFNGFIDEQKNVEGEANFTLVQFDNEYEIVHAGIPVEEVPHLTNDTFIPRGTTALLDAVGRAIGETEDRLVKLADDDKPDKVIVVIMTDGYENASREIKREDLIDTISRVEKEEDWGIVYLGADQDAIKEGGSIGISMDTSAAYSGASSANAIRMASAKVATYRGTGLKDALSYSAQDREAMMSGEDADIDAAIETMKDQTSDSSS